MKWRVRSKRLVSVAYVSSCNVSLIFLVEIGLCTYADPYREIQSIFNTRTSRMMPHTHMYALVAPQQGQRVFSKDARLVTHISRHTAHLHVCLFASNLSGEVDESLVLLPPSINKEGQRVWVFSGQDRH